MPKRQHIDQSKLQFQVSILYTGLIKVFLLSHICNLGTFDIDLSILHMLGSAGRAAPFAIRRPRLGGQSVQNKWCVQLDSHIDENTSQDQILDYPLILHKVQANNT